MPLPAYRRREGKPMKRWISAALLAMLSLLAAHAGRLDTLVPIFEDESGYNVKVIAVGCGQALAMGERGDADVLLVHAPSSEVALVDSGAAINRRLVMHKDFINVG